MRANDAPPGDDPLEQQADSPSTADPVLDAWFLAEDERANRATDLRAFSTGNQVTPLVDGRATSRRLCAEIESTVRGDEVYFLDFRGDLDERLAGDGTEVGDVLGRAAARGVAVFGLLWRSHPKLLHQSEEANAEFVRQISDDGGEVLLDARTRRAGQPPPEAGRGPPPVRARTVTSPSSAGSTWGTAGTTTGRTRATPR